MAKSVQPFSWKNGFRQLGTGTPWAKETRGVDDEENEPHYVVSPSSELLTSTVHNSLGLNTLRTWPKIYDGTSSPHDLPNWWKPETEVDVLICGAGPAGLQIAVSLARQGVSFRIIDKAATPLTAGRADGVQPRFLETLHSWGLATEVHEEGPLIERTAIYKDDFEVERDPSKTHPVRICLKNDKTGIEETVHAKFLVGSDGAGSLIRKKLQIPFDGVSTDIYWGILDCIFESDYPHAWVFGSVISSKHGGCVIIPREDGYIRLYTQLDISSTGPIARGRQAKNKVFEEEGGHVETTSITAEEVLEQANRIFSPYKLKFAAPLSWFTVWKISERVARSFSSPDSRVHLAGDASHIHSVMGAFGLNASIMDSANLAWKIGLCAKDFARLESLGPTYDSERRYHANRIIHVSGSYLRFVCNSTFPLASFTHVRPEWPPLPEQQIYNQGEDLQFLKSFFEVNGQFLLGLDADYASSVLNVAGKQGTAVAPRNGVRAPNPRICSSVGSTGYLYDFLTGAATLHLVIFASDLQGPIRRSLTRLAKAMESPESFYNLYGGRNRFNSVLITKCLPHEVGPLLSSDSLQLLEEYCTVLYDDRAPDEDAHTCYEIDHAKGAIVFVRPDLWIGTSVYVDEVDKLEQYFAGWLLPVGKAASMSADVSIKSADGSLKGVPKNSLNGISASMINGVEVQT